MSNGNTPTGVGKTRGCYQHSPPFLKHPHGRGEDGSVAKHRTIEEETPPRAWGRPIDIIKDLGELGNTPTGVGKTVPSLRLLFLHVETPPRAWGRHVGRNASLNGGGNTPTGVGKTMKLSTSGRPARKHPHGRGEDSGRKTSSRHRLETPPRAWGRHYADSASIDYLRNTPTGVGKTVILLYFLFASIFTLISKLPQAA